MNRSNSSATDNPAIVAVPFGGTANQTVVTFTNAVNTGQLTICKASAEPTLQATTFNFTYSYVNGVTTNGTAALTPGQCSDPWKRPVVDPDGSDRGRDLGSAFAGVVVSDVEVDNGALLSDRSRCGHDDGEREAGRHDGDLHQLPRAVTAGLRRQYHFAPCSLRSISPAGGASTTWR